MRFLWSIGAAVGSIWCHIWTCGELCLFSLPPLLDLLGEGELVPLAEGHRVSLTVELRCFFRLSWWSPAACF